MKCEYMVSQEDVETTITSENYVEKHIVALSSWYVDIHQNTSIDTDSVACTYLNGIPYEAMIPCTQKNVLVACRGYGASHIGLAANRLTKTMLSLGYASGKALDARQGKALNDKYTALNSALISKARILGTSWGTSLTIPGGRGPHGLVLNGQSTIYLIWVAGDAGQIELNKHIIYGEETGIEFSVSPSTGEVKITCPDEKNRGLVYIGT